MNNVDTLQVTKYREEVIHNPDEAKFTARIEGDWLFEEGGPQFRSVVRVRDGNYVMEASHPNFAGPGVRPGPMAFGLFWFAACYTSTFVTEATMRKIRLNSVHTLVEADLDYSAQFDLGKGPRIRGYRVILEVSGDAPNRVFEDLRAYAVSHCMGMFTIQNAIPLSTELKIRK
jgi:hypothetical protein